ncbi:MAG: S-adenosylmethionine decarboxylase [Candidatus Gottesmanbacteria bacterium]|nr:S-adenosylmethionine decarboxylase [Candidatus Gottesmanbacteria bacterium]
MLRTSNTKQKDTFGQELILNLYECNPEKISSGEEIKKFVIELCDHVIHMKRYGEVLIPHFGHENPITSGFSLVQLIETSSVTAHFSEYKKSVYLNIFSCAWYDPEKARDFCVKFFEAKRFEEHLILRE